MGGATTPILNKKAPHLRCGAIKNLDHGKYSHKTTNNQ